ncbi:Bgt-3374 [Blumeria graminis f. sp. tritici]|uniref:Endopolyphosphatase n=2 Tax=Blumeria graminis f. sp. tritici TaxID=62690 RepID=A0A061HHH9_BLUGR|nr:Vacuolar endopolyphosphatase [Blumeria graminis f. sp. tritici 96224]VDB89713.1 Bgt-3374 [Blumeria graminis f. sp. tritici]
MLLGLQGFFERDSEPSIFPEISLFILIAAGKGQPSACSRKHSCGTLGNSAAQASFQNSITTTPLRRLKDLHPDPFYKAHTSTEEADACHRGIGFSGLYGAETSDCDSPSSLINATFKWIEENIKDEIDFILWTGDSSRHDNDIKIPRTQEEVLKSNQWIVSKFLEVFGKEEDPSELIIPIVSTFGNNDMLPHNVMLAGPNQWLDTYASMWSSFIPKDQIPDFQKGGGYVVEVIPGNLAVLSLNTMYFFTHNVEVNGCSDQSDPGYGHMEWFREQLQLIREKGLKVIIVGHVPPARTPSKTLWYETCWQKYTLWLQKYRDVVIGGFFGHMNIDHFLLHDTKDISIDIIDGDKISSMRTMMDEELTIESTNDYLRELRKQWTKLPTQVSTLQYPNESNNPYKHLERPENSLKDIGGPWGERYQISFVSPSVVPNFLPTLRVMEYNISGLNSDKTWDEMRTHAMGLVNWPKAEADHKPNTFSVNSKIEEKSRSNAHPGLRNSKVNIPSPPSKTSLPGPAYSPQTFTLLGYTQYFANLTDLNNDSAQRDEEIKISKWLPGRNRGKIPKHEPRPKKFEYCVEYDTSTDTLYNLKDLTVRSYLKLAQRMGNLKPKKSDHAPFSPAGGNRNVYSDKYRQESAEIMKKHRSNKGPKKVIKNKVWLRFIWRAFVGTLEEADIKVIQGDSISEKNSLDPYEDEL